MKLHSIFPSEHIGFPLCSQPSLVAVFGWAVCLMGSAALAQQPTCTPPASGNASCVQGVGPGYWPTASVAIPAPAAPTLSQVAGGTIGATTYYAKVTYVGVGGETAGSAESSLTVSANKLLVITGLAAAGTAPNNATGWKPYVSTSTGTETLQAVSGNCTLNTAGNACAIGANWTEPTSGLVAGAAVPISDTTWRAVNLAAGTSFCNGATMNYPSTSLAMAGTATNYVSIDPGVGAPVAPALRADARIRSQIGSDGVVPFG